MRIRILTPNSIGSVVLTLSASLIVACSSTPDAAPTGNAGSGAWVATPASPNAVEATRVPSSAPAPTADAGAAAATCPVAMLRQCKLCHDGKGTAGTPMGLVTYADFLAPSKTDPARPVYQAVQARMHDATKPMPPTGMLTAQELAVIDDWVAAGAQDCGFGAPDPSPARSTPTAEPQSSAPAPIGDIAEYLSADGRYFIKEPPTSLPVGPDSKDAEFCFNLVAHGTQSPLAQDSTPFEVPASEFYHKFQFQVPYGTTMVGLSTKPIVDNAAVLHHWLLFHVLSDTGEDGAHEDELIGIQTGSEVLSGWGPGASLPELPPGVGGEMPPGNGFMTLEFHYFNNTGSVQHDRSGVRICATTKPPPNVATLTWLGTEAIVIAPHDTGTATGNCTPGGGSTTQDIHLVFSTPHMHKLGSRLTTTIHRTGGATETVLDEAFSFNDQRQYNVSNVVHPGDTLSTTCTWMNDSDDLVTFGESTSSEMCYNFILSYPAHLLSNPAGGGLEGSSNMCLN